MNWFKLVGHDLRCGLLRLRYIIAAMLAIIPCLEFLFSLNAIDKTGSWMDYLLYTFRGIGAVDKSDPTRSINLPFVWLLIMSASLFVNLDYMLLDLTNNGQQIIIRSQSRKGWYFAKCVWNLASTMLFFVLLACVELVFVGITGGLLSANNTEDAFMNLFGMVTFDVILLTKVQGMIIALLLPYLTAAALGMLEMTLCLFVKPVVSYLICMAILVLSVYWDSPFVLGNGAMTIRSGLIASKGQDIVVSILIDIAVIGVCIIVGSEKFQRLDVLGSKE